ncbi:MAG: gliding motility-associated C-terminal domain-containing protein, partial [Bacteroidota bacterium]
LTAGTYTVTVTDQNTCTASSSFVIAEPSQLTVSISKSDAACILSNGSATANPVGGTGNYSYQWSNGQSTKTIILLAAGTYTVTVTDINNCTSTQTTNIGNILGPSITASSVDSINCFNGSDGAINITVIGGSLINSFLWNDGNGSEDRTGLINGNYTVTVTDILGCSVSQSFAVRQPLQLLADATGAPSTCGNNNGTVSSSATGGTGAYTYLWSTGSSLQNLINVAGNSTYTVTVTDANNCTAADAVSIAGATNPNIAASNVDSVNCFGGSDGSIAITIGGGTPGFTYLWNDGNTSEDRLNLVEGNYSVTVTDLASCTVNQSFIVGAPPVIDVTTSSAPAGCGNANGSAVVNASGGTGALHYVWNNGVVANTNDNIVAGLYTVTISDVNNCQQVRIVGVANAGAPAITLDSSITPSCFGSTNGSIYITVNGGVSPYTYQWSNGALTQDITNLPSGTYTVTVTDSIACVDSLVITLSEPALLSVTFNKIDPSCGLNNGSVTALPAGGTSPYQYLWSNAQVTQTINGLAAGNYTVTVTDLHNCTATADTDLVAHPSPVIVSDSTNSVSCFSGTDGDIYILVISGSSPFSYLWSNGAVVEDNINIPAGQYTITVTDSLGCTDVAVFNVNQPAAGLSGSFTNVAASCNVSNGSSTVNPAGGTPLYTYLWSNGQTTQTAVNLAAGNYTVTVTDSRNCSIIFTTTVPASGQPVISNVIITDVNCNGESNGAIDITVTGGIPPYIYNWTPGNIITQDISGITAGDFIIQITDSVGCSFIDTFTVQQPIPLSATFTVNNSTCNLANGSARIIVSGGTSPYSYLWNTGSVADSIFNQLSGTYTVTVTDNHSCDSVFTVFIGNSPGPSAVVDSVTDVNCIGSTNGAIYITPSGGLFPYQYLWSDNSTQQDLINVAAGIYTVTITDANLCTATLSDTVFSPQPFTYNLTSVNASCGQSNGSATVNNLAGGTAPYTITWSNGDTGITADSLINGVIIVTITDAHNCTVTDSVTIVSLGGPQFILLNQVEPSCYAGSDGTLEIDITGANPPFTILWSNGDVTGIADSLSAGIYTVTVTDNIGCSATDLYTLDQPDSFAVSFVTADASCGLSNGSVTATVTGGTPGYSLLWSNGDTGLTADSLSGNIYTVTVTDANFCSKVFTVTVNSQPSPSIALDSIKNVSCNGATDGGIYITVTGGTLPFNYIWSNSSSSEDLTGVSGGNYTVIVTDFAGCGDTLTSFINEAAAININYTVVDAACGDSTGSINTTVGGGTGGFTYLWSNGKTTSSINNLYSGTYTLTVTDAAFCTMQAVVIVGNLNGPQVTLASHMMVLCSGGNNGFINVNINGGVGPYSFLWSNAQTTQNISGLAPGIYTLTVTDNNGCNGIFTDTITEPVPMSLTAVVVNPTCFLSNGAIVVTPSGGSPAYTYLWSNGVISSGNSGLSAGQAYTVTITDVNLCTFDSSFVLVNSGAPVITLISLSDVTCFDAANGSIDIDVSGGVGPYTYFWQGILQTTQDVSALPPGIYNVIIADSTGCSSNAQYTINEPSEILVNFPLLNNTNCGQSNGTIIASATGGTAPYNYQWSNGALNDTIFNLSAGSYTVTVTDFSGCTVSHIANISDLGGPVITAVDSTLITCPGGNNGSITIAATGGVAPLTYTWTNVSSNQSSVNNLSANTYTVSVADAANCQVIRSINITDPPDFVINAALSQYNPPYNLTCFQTADGSIDVTVTGGTPPYIYIWSTGSNNEDINNLTAGSYSLVIRDSRACQAYDTIVLTQPPQIIAFAGADITVCGVDTLTLFADSVAANLLGHWSAQPGSSVGFVDASVNNTVATNLTVGDLILTWTVSQLSGDCPVSDSLIVTVKDSITANAGTDKTDLCGEVYALDATQPNFGTGYWMLLSGSGIIADTGSAVTVVNELSLGINNFVWTIKNGNCIDSDTVLVYQLDSVNCLSLIELPSAFSPNGDGFNDFFVVKGIEDFRENKLTVFDRWGVEVYSKSNYLNEWNGVNNDNDDIPDGTYFYILNVQGVREVFKGFVDVRR